MLKRLVLAFAPVGCGALGAEAADAPLQQIADTLDVSTLDLTVTTCWQQFLFSNYLPRCG